MGRAPTLTDHFFRTTYRGAYRLMRAYWALRHPKTHGALVALWHEGKLLLVKNSYAPYYSLPGGYVRAGETSRQAAVRELREELGVVAKPEALGLAVDQHHEWEGKQEHIEIYELEWGEPADIVVDNREVVSAQYMAPERALRLTLFPPIRDLIERRLTGALAIRPGAPARDAKGPQEHR